MTEESVLDVSSPTARLVGAASIAQFDRVGCRAPFAAGSASPSLGGSWRRQTPRPVVFLSGEGEA
jgi:hypothetical protein